VGVLREPCESNLLTEGKDYVQTGLLVHADTSRAKTLINQENGMQSQCEFQTINYHDAASATRCVVAPHSGMCSSVGPALVLEAPSAAARRAMRALKKSPAL